MINASRPLIYGRSITRIHAVGIGGMGMGPLAIYLARRGWRVTGEDDALNPAMATELSRAEIGLGESGRVPEDIDLVVVSTAVKPSHPSLLAARQRGIGVVRRGELLAEVAKERRLIAICGSHGKTSATAMLIAIMRQAGWQVSYVLGGLFGRGNFSPAEVGQSDWMVAEIDESDGTIDHFSPEMTLVVNLDWDHPDQYPSLAELKAAFSDLLGRTKRAVVGWDGCATTMQLFAARSQNGVVATYGYSGDFKIEGSAVSGETQTLNLGGRFGIQRAEVRARGDYNRLNAAGALAVAQLAGVEICARSLADFPGVRRRQSILRQQADLTVLEDYAHHPAEIRALLGDLRVGLGEGERLVVVFQPHRYSRTRQFKAEFAAALTLADSLHLLDVYPAGESPRMGGTTADLYAELVRLAPRLPVNYLPGDRAGVLELLRQSRRSGDWVAFVGAGDIEQAARQWLETMDRDAARGAIWDELAQSLRDAVTGDTLVKREESLAQKTTLRVGGAARIYVEPASVADLKVVVKRVSRTGLPLCVLGRGSNLLVPDAGVNGVVVSLRRSNWETFEKLADGRIRVGAGLRLKNLCGLAAKEGMEGFEFLEGIPGNVGGALRMNAGAMGGWMFDVVDQVEALTVTGDLVTYRRDELHVRYRHCAELERSIAIGAVLRPATLKEADEIGRQIDVYRSKRQESQPREPSAGCIFKNPENDSAGRLIEACGLKGERIGDAEVSTVHGNFIINRGRATSAEVIELVRRVRGEVERQTGSLLEPEVLLYGSQWEDVL